MWVGGVGVGIHRPCCAGSRMKGGHRPRSHDPPPPGIVDLDVDDLIDALEDAELLDDTEMEDPE